MIPLSVLREYMPKLKDEDLKELGPVEYDQSKVPEVSKKHAENVRRKVYLPDMTESFARGVEYAGLMSSEASNAARTADLLSKDTQARFKDQIEGTTHSDEVIDARRTFGGVTYPTLNDRLDALADTLNVTDFGAVGDGITDDTLAIEQAFKVAEIQNRGVSFAPRTYVWNPTETIETSITVDFGHAKFKKSDSASGNKPLIKIVHDTSKIDIDPESIETVINRKTTRIPELAGYGQAYVQVTDSNSAIFKRRGVAGDNGYGTNKFDHFMIDNQGYLLNEVTFDFNSITKLIVQPIDSYYTYVRGGRFSTDATNTTDNYYQSGIVVEKSNTIIESIDHSAKSDSTSASSDGFLVIKDCANVKVDDVVLNPRLAINEQGTYDISATRVCGLTLNNVSAQNYTDDLWGVMGGNFIKDLTITNSKLNRVDAHMGVHNLTIVDTEIGFKGITVVGFGKLTIRNVKTFAPHLLTLRTDYGASWDGVIDISDIEHVRTSDSEMAVISAELYYDFDYGYTSRDFGLGTSLSVKDYVLNNNGIDTTANNYITTLLRLRVFKGGDGTMRHTYHLPETATFENVRVVNSNSARDGFVFITDTDLSSVRAREAIKDSDPYKFDSNVDVVLEGIDFADFSHIDWRSNLFVNAGGTKGRTGNDDYGLILDRPYWTFYISRSKKIHAVVEGRYAKVFLNDVEASMIDGNTVESRSFYFVNNTIVKPMVATETSVAVDVRYDRIYFSNTYFDACYLPNGTMVANPFAGPYREVMTINNVLGSTIEPKVAMSSSKLSPHIDLSKIKTDLSNYDFQFGDFLPFRNYYPFKGAYANKPAGGLKLGITYYDTTNNRMIFYDGTNWRDYNGNIV